MFKSFVTRKMYNRYRGVIAVTLRTMSESELAEAQGVLSSLQEQLDAEVTSRWAVTADA